LLAGAVAAPVIVSFGLDSIASAGPVSGGNQTDNPFDINPRRLKRRIRRFAKNAQNFGNQTFLP
jgi:hypothetical protein